MSETIFTKIIKGEIPSVKVYEDDICIVIMDKFPNTEGQLLIIPKKEVDYVFDLDNETYKHLFDISKKIIKAVDQALTPYRTCLIVEGFEVPHAHIKIFPVKEAKLNTSTGPEASDEKLNELAEKIKNFI